jgi:hypothetical protein
MKKYISGKVIFWVPYFGGLRAWMTFKKAEMAKPLLNGLSMIETTPFQPQTVGFHNLVGVGIVPV